MAIAEHAPAPALRRRLPALPLGVTLALAWLALMVVTALGADFLVPYSITALDLKARLAPPALMGGTWAHPLGTDELGRDVLSRLIMSIRMSLLIAFFGTIIAATLGTALGFLAAHFRKAVEQVVLMAIDFQASMPFMIIALAVLAFLGNSLPLFIALMGFHSWERYARISRGITLAANEQGYAAAILLLESGLSFLGLGVQPPLASLGNMVGYGREYISHAPWIMLAPAATIVLTTLSVSLLGDWLRDRLDPTLR
jgi:peptide/nickel transport system permease protein